MISRIVLRSSKSPPKKRSRVKQVQPDRESQFRLLFEKLAITVAQPRSQFVFHPSRKWRFDFAWPELFVAVEIDGGIFIGGAKSGHRSVGGMMSDMEKLNQAAILGWCVLRFHSKDLDSKPWQTIEQAIVALMTASIRREFPIPAIIDETTKEGQALAKLWDRCVMLAATGSE